VTDDETRQVLGVEAASPEEALAYFYRTKLRCETDPYDVHHGLQHGEPGFVVVDVRRAAAFAQEHVADAVNLSHHDMTPELLAELDPAQVYVTYGWGPGCNGGTRGAVKLAAAGLRVKEMIGGLEYWKRQGYPTRSTADSTTE
jgi:rhodanese-related sulfurtransferase